MSDELTNNPLCEKFQADIPDECSVVSVKINNVDLDADGKATFNWFDINAYVGELSTILFSSAGLHENGKSGKPHVHYVFICKKFKPPSNPSQHRKRYAEKTEADFENVSFQFKDLDKSKPKYHPLSYPLKEGRHITYHVSKMYLYNGSAMPNDYIKFLKGIGKSIYDVELANNLKKDKCEERKKQSLADLYKICVENKSKFGNLREMMEMLDDVYIAELELEDYPDPKNYKTNCQKIAVKLKILKYSAL